MNSSLRGNNASKNNYNAGIYLGADSNNNILSGTQPNSNTEGGIYVYSTRYNTLINNNANSDSNYGISLFGSFNKIIDNNANSNKNYGYSRPIP